LSIVAGKNLHLEQLDVETAFLHWNLEEEIFMAQPKGFEVQGKEKFNEFMKNLGFHRCEEDHYCYVKKYVDNYIIFVLYVDDMLIVGANMEEIYRLKKQLSENFKLKDLGSAKQILGM